MTTEKKSRSQRWTPEQVFKITESMQLVERDRASDRALINNQFNGKPPYTAAECEKFQIKVNCNRLEGKNILVPAINQLNNATIFKERFFTAQSKGGKPEKKQEYSDTFTRNIHEPLKEGEAGYRQMMLMMDRNASVGLHGIGPVMWTNGFRWRARFIPLEDLLIPTDTKCDLSNLMFFAVNLYLTAGEFFDMACADKVQKGWKSEMVNKIIKDIIKPDQQQNQNWGTIQDQPEKMVEWLKQNRCMWDYDAATTVKLRVFFYKHHDDKKWYRCIVLREGTPSVPAEKQTDFIYDGTEPFADTVSQIIHIQYGDNSICAPRKLHSVRGLGVDLYGQVEVNNRVYCEFQQHVLLDLKTFLRIENPVDRDRPKLLELSQYSVVEQGVGFVPKEERYSIDPRLAEMALSQNKQLMGESSKSYVKDTESESSQPRTATEFTGLANQATEAISNMLQAIYAQEEFYWREEVRRFCDPHSADDEVKAFQKKCTKDGIPKELMRAENWTIKIERVLGGGDQVIATQEASALLGQSQRYDPNSQRIILRKWTTTVTRDPKMGELLVPDKDDATSGQIQAENIFATLFSGIPLEPRQAVERTDYIESLLGMLQSKVSQIEQTSNVGTMDQIIGLKTVAMHIEQNIQILEADPEKKQLVKEYGDLLGRSMNLVKAFEQRLLEQQQKEMEASQIDPEAQAKIQMQAEASQQKMQLNAMSKEQQMRQKQAAFELRMQQDIERHRFDMEKAMQEAQNEVLAEGLRTGSEISNLNAKADADIEAKKKLAAAKPPATANGSKP